MSFQVAQLMYCAVLQQVKPTHNIVVVKKQVFMEDNTAKHNTKRYKLALRASPLSALIDVTDYYVMLCLCVFDRCFHPKQLIDSSDIFSDTFFKQLDCHLLNKYSFVALNDTNMKQFTYNYTLSQILYMILSRTPVIFTGQLGWASYSPMLCLIYLHMSPHMISCTTACLHKAGKVFRGLCRGLGKYHTTLQLYKQCRTAKGNRLKVILLRNQQFEMSVVSRLSNVAQQKAQSFLV